MALRIETFSSLKGGNSFFKAVTHPDAAEAAARLVRRLEAAGPIALYDPLGFAEGFAACSDLSRCRIVEAYVQAVEEIGRERLGCRARPVTELGRSRAALVFVAAFDAGKLVDQIRHLVPAMAEIVTLDAMRLDETLLSNPRNYLDKLNFATNFTFFRDRDGHHTRLVTANYWSNYATTRPELSCTLLDAAGGVLARWRETTGDAQAAIVIDSREIRRRFELPEFEGQLFIHVVGAAGHDQVKYALDMIEDGGPSLSCTHDANAWPADFYAGLPAPRADETVILWLQNSLNQPIPAGSIALNLMGDERRAAFPESVPPFATVALDVARLLPDARWPQQIEIAAGRHVVRPRYEIIRGGRRRIAHPNVERIDLEPTATLAELGPLLGKGFILAAPLLPPEQWRSIALPTPMATTQEFLPIMATLYDPEGRQRGQHRFGRMARRDSVALDLDRLLGAAAAPAFGHVELTYDWSAGVEADGWLHGLFRYEDRSSGHVAETSFGAHMFNTVMTWRDEPQSYSGRAPGLTTRLFLRLGENGYETISHLIYPASTPWHAHSATHLILLDDGGREVARRQVAIPCGGSLFWRVAERFSRAERDLASGGMIIVRDTTCRLFGYHGLTAPGGRFSLDHMFGF
jgi:hypothetical protein